MENWSQEFAVSPHGLMYIVKYDDITSSHYFDFRWNKYIDQLNFFDMFCIKRILYVSYIQSTKKVFL